LNAKEAKAMEKTLKELKERYIDFGDSMKDTANAIGSTKKLWREGNKSRLINVSQNLLQLVRVLEPVL